MLPTCRGGHPARGLSLRFPSYEHGRIKVQIGWLMVDPRQLIVAQSDLKKRLLPQLQGHLFHVTTHHACRSIRRTGWVLADPPDLPSARKWPYDSYFRSIGCVSLCDLRTADEEKVDVALAAYFFLDPWHGDPDPAFLILSPQAADSVVSYGEAIDQGALAKMIVPHVEAGYKGDLPISDISDILVVRIKRPPPHPFLVALRSAN